MTFTLSILVAPAISSRERHACSPHPDPRGKEMKDDPMKVFDPEQLARANGDNDDQVFVAVNGSVYDLSSSKRWARGKHMNRHRAGADLSTDILGAPHGPEVLDRFPKVGIFQGSPVETHSGLRGKLEPWLKDYPFFRRHPHPAVVHFPLALPIAMVAFEAIALVGHSPCTEWAAYCCLLMGLFVLPAAMVTGYLTWWINYEASDLPVLRKKRRLAWVALVLGLLAATVRTFMVSEPLQVIEVGMILYLFDIVLLAVIVSWVGYLGGTLTFPYQHD
jgi:predicted heme/steroid binding protein/uncharacterized membrane protein